MRNPAVCLLAIVLVSPTADVAVAGADQSFRIGVSFPGKRSPAPLDGRILFMISKDDSKEPRFQINDGPNCQQIFGIDVDGLKPATDAMFDGSVLGFPLRSLNDIPPGEYWVQALLHRYETFHRADGYTVKP